MKPDYERVATVISAIITRMVLANPGPDEGGEDDHDDDDNRVRTGVDR